MRVNGFVVNPHRILALEDRIEVEQRDWVRVFIVKELRDKQLPKAEASRVYEDLSPPRPILDPIERMARRRPAIREKGAGRPSKKERRKMERWRG